MGSRTWNSRCRGTLVIAACLLPAACIAEAGMAADEEHLGNARREFRNYNLPLAKYYYEKAWRDTASSPANMVQAGRVLGFIHWHFYQHLDSTRYYYQRIFAIEGDDPDRYSKLAGYESRSGDFLNARMHMSRALSMTQDTLHKKELWIAMADIALAEARSRTLARRSVDSILVREAFRNIAATAGERPEDIELARTQLGLALVLGEWDSAQRAWNNYFRIIDRTALQGFLKDADVRFRDACAKLKKAKRSGRVELVSALAGARFYDYAVMMIHRMNLEAERNDELRELIEYDRFKSRYESNAFAYYRRRAFGEDDTTSFFTGLDSAQSAFYRNLRGGNGGGAIGQREFRDEIYKRYGLKMMYFGRGQRDGAVFFGGHCYRERDVRVEQYGREANFKFFELHNTIGASYQHWFYDNQGIGGWATADGEVMQVRDWFVNYPLSVWERLTDPALRQRWLEEMHLASATDDSIASEDPCALLRGLERRIKFKTYSGILDSLESLGHGGDRVKMSFLVEVERILQRSSIDCHEARHILDIPFVNEHPDSFPLEVREYRAKLSEIAFSEFPLLIVAESILEEGMGNKKILEVLVNWMDDHRPEIGGLDRSRPLLPQLDLLTDDQIRQAIREADPLYRMYRKGKGD